MRQDHIDARGRRVERVSEYFNFDLDPEKGYKKVTRIELLAILTQINKAREAMIWYRRLWRWLTRPLGSGPMTAVPPTQGEIDRGEVAP